ncbi:hypothetical protein MBLNU230_g6744t1 [Neophaeotheca triangularis]
MLEPIAPVAGHKRKRTISQAILPGPQERHPYLIGNFAPIQQTLPLTPCTFTGTIPEELADGEYVRNGSNPVSNEDLGRDAHWFDGDGMLSGVSFPKNKQTGKIEPEFVNQFVLTDLYLSTLASPHLKVPILPSIATLVSPVASIFWVTLRILRAIFLVILSHLPGSKQKIKKISVGNTHIIFHDGRALATCESGPPMRVQLPGLETVGWYNGSSAEGEPKKVGDEKEHVLGEDGGLISWMREWTTAHPKVDPISNEMLMYHSSFAPPYVQYSIIPAESSNPTPEKRGGKVLNAGVAGVSGSKMMHDFGVSLRHTVIMDLPLSLDPINQVKGIPALHYDSSKPSRFGVFPRRQPDNVCWFETDACCIFHTANTWDDVDDMGKTIAVNMLACRLTSATMVYAAGNIAAPEERKPTAITSELKRMSFFSPYDESDASLPSPTSTDPFLPPLTKVVTEESLYEEDQCRLYYYHFSLLTGTITHQWALTAIPFEFPSTHPSLEMQSARYIYGCSTTTTSFGSALGKATKIDALVKVNTATLIARGKAHPPSAVTGVVDKRSMPEVLTQQASQSPEIASQDPIQVFTLPAGCYAQEPRFVPSATPSSEDDGFLLFYVFDESQLDPTTGDPPADDDEKVRARSELWVLDAKGMKEVVGKVLLPQRVPYGLHGSFFPKEKVGGQRGVEGYRSVEAVTGEKEGGLWMMVRDGVERLLG